MGLLPERTGKLKHGTIEFDGTDLSTLNDTAMGPKGILSGDILCDEGKIVSVGEAVNAADYKDAEIIDASGKYVLPGFVDSHSHIGTISTYTEQDSNEMTNPVTAEMDVKYGIDARSKQFSKAISQGITTSGIAPGSANVVGGLVAAVKSSGKDITDMTIKSPIALKAAMEKLRHATNLCIQMQKFIVRLDCNDHKVICCNKLLRIDAKIYYGGIYGYSNKTRLLS